VLIFFGAHMIHTRVCPLNLGVALTDAGMKITTSGRQCVRRIDEAKQDHEKSSKLIHEDIRRKKGIIALNTVDTLNVYA
jgi:actin-related protein